MDSLRPEKGKSGLLRRVDEVEVPYAVLEKVSGRVINRVACDVSSKPPATIEWE